MVIWAAGACCICAWRYQDGSNGWRWALLLGVLSLSTFALAWALRRVAPRTLRWDGAAWSLSGDPALGMASATVALDLQSLLLVRLGEAGRRTQWLWLEQAGMPQRWNALRRAVYCRAPGPEPTASPGAPVPRAHRSPELPPA